MNEKEKLLLNEAKLTCSMLGNGLNSLRKSSILNVGLYYQSFFSLSIGIERLLKIIIIIKYRCENNGFFPTSEEIKVKSFGHNIIKLIDFLDIKIENEIELKILEFLNNFSKKSRYFNIDGIINENIDYENPLHSWKKIQEDILKIIKKGKKIPNKEILATQLDEISSIFMYDLNGNIIDHSINLLNAYEPMEDLQKYETEYVFYIIRSIVWKLKELERTKSMMPYLTEVFYIYLGSYTRGEIRNKKNWLNLT